MKTINWFCFAAGANVANLESEKKKARKRKTTVWSGISFKTSFSLRSAIFDVSI